MASFPEELATLARLTEGDEDLTQVLDRVVRQATSLVPGCTGAALTVSRQETGSTMAVTDERVGRCHDVQFGPDGDGPALEALRYAEPRRVDDLADEDRWPRFRAVASAEGFASCLALPLLTDRAQRSALNLYSDRPRTFAGTTHDVAVLVAAQGGVALDNALLYRQNRELVEHLHETLTTRGLIERAKGVLMARHGVDSEDAFALLRAESQRTNRKARDVATAVLDQHGTDSAAADVVWRPVRHPSRRTHSRRPLASGEPPS